MKKQIWIPILVVLVIVAGVLILLSQKSEQPQEAKEKEVIKIGVIEPLTGSGSIYGEWQMQGVNIAIDELKKEGMNFDFIIEDSKGDAKEAVTAINKLINIDNVQTIISGSYSNSVIAMAPVANNNQRILFSTLSSSPGITQAGDYIFRNRISGDFEVEKLAEKIKKNFDIKKIGIITLNDESGYSYRNAFIQLFDENVKIETKFISKGEVDFRTIITQLKSLDPDAVVFLGPVEDTARFLNQAKEMNFKTQYFSVSSIESEKLFEIAGDEANGLIFATEGILINNPAYSSFRDEYKSRYDSDPTIYAINSYDAVRIMTKLIDKVGNDAEKIKKELYKLKYEGVEGIVSFDFNGDVIKEIVMKKVENQKFVPYEQ